MPYPFLFPAAGLAAGILAASAFRLPLWTSLAALLACLALAWAFYGMKKNKASLVILLVGTIALGSSLYSWKNLRFEGNALHTLKIEDYADFEGVLLLTPSREADRDVLLLGVESVTYRKERRTVRGRLRVTVPLSPEAPIRLKLAVGDRVRVSAQLLPAREFQNFNPPFFSRYLRSSDIHSRAFTKSSKLVERLGGGGFPIRRFVSKARARLQASLESQFPSTVPGGISAEGAVLEALLLGEEGRLAPDTVQVLQKTGLYHLFAISGAHIAIVSYIIFTALRLVRFPRRPASVVLIVFLVLYAFLVEGSPSVLRAVIMAVLYLLGKLLWRDVHLLNTVALSAFLLLLVQPFSLFDLGFQLTYAATLAIVLFYPRIIKRLPRLPLKLSELTAVSVAASAGVLPFLVQAFNRVTFSSLLLNYAAVPLVGVIMAAGYVFLPLSLLSAAAVRPLALGLALLIKVFLRLTHLLDPIRVLSYRIPTPHAVTTCGYALFLLLLLAPVIFRRQRLVVGLGFGLCLALLITYPFPASVQDLTITFLDVGEGDSILVEFPGTRKMLIDGGGFPEGTFDVGERVVSPFLWRKGIKRIDFLVLTHPHPDHLYGLPAIASNFRIGEFWEAVPPAGGEAYRHLLAALPSSVVRRKVFRGYVLRDGASAVEVLHPGPNAPPIAGEPDNDLSLVLKTSRGEASFLLTGDIGWKAEAEILEADASAAQAQVMKSPHHGSATSSSPPFLAAVRPEVVVISVGAGNRFRFPSPEVLERYASERARVLRTDLDGAVEITTDGRTIRIRTAAPRGCPPGLRYD